MSSLGLTVANTIVEAALKKARELNTAPLAVAVLDETGQLKAYQREDQTSLLRTDIAIGKAWGALGLGRASRLLGRVAEERPAFIQALSVMAGGKLVPVPGGVLIRAEDNAIIGSVGISGDTSDIDEACAVAGIEAAGLRADAGAAV